MLNRDYPGAYHHLRAKFRPACPSFSIVATALLIHTQMDIRCLPSSMNAGSRR